MLYASAFAARYNQASFDYVYDHFAADFGGVRPYIIRERSWSVQTESTYRWGAALNGLMLDGIAAVGPGYDDIAVPNRPRHYRDRAGGQFYRDSWEAALRSVCRIVHVETWSELHEGTEICETVEYGRQYIGLTREYADRFRAIINPVRASMVSPGHLARAVDPLASVEVRFNGAIRRESANSNTVFLTYAGADGLFGTADDARITPAGITAGDDRVTLDLAGVALAEGRYQISVLGTGAAPLTAPCNGPFYGAFTGSFPTGADNQAGDLHTLFSRTHPTARPDFDMDDDVDQTDFGHLQACFSGPGVAMWRAECQDAKLDGDHDVDGEDLRIFRKCWTGAGRAYELDCADGG